MKSHELRLFQNNGVLPISQKLCYRRASEPRKMSAPATAVLGNELNNGSTWYIIIVEKLSFTHVDKSGGAMVCLKTLGSIAGKCLQEFLRKDHLTTCMFSSIAKPLQIYRCFLMFLLTRIGKRLYLKKIVERCLQNFILDINGIFCHRFPQQ